MSQPLFSYHYLLDTSHGTQVCRRHDHLVSVLFGDLLSHSYNITFSMFLDLVTVVFADFACHFYQHNILEMFLYLVSALVDEGTVG